MVLLMTQLQSYNSAYNTQDPGMLGQLCMTELPHQPS